VAAGEVWRLAFRNWHASDVRARPASGEWPDGSAVERKTRTMADIVVITGASRGIGRATALLAADKGWDVAFSYAANEAAARDVAAAIEAKGRRALAVRADNASESDILRLFETVDTKLGTLCALVNNAGIGLQVMRLEAMTAERINRTMQTNVTGTFLCAREAVKRMSTRHGGKGGAIVNVSSVAARIGGAGEWLDYGASKGAMDTFTLGLSKEVGSEGIRVNAVRPGLIETEFHAAAGAGDRLARFAPMVPMQRSGSAEEVATSIVWLMSPEASYVTGALVDVAGGR
jgi:NAD(P)-dependent dehydrogenase (short-subunit alcohol dehydrogenase family)